MGGGGFLCCSTREDLSIDVSITNVGLISDEAMWFLFSGYGETDRQTWFWNHLTETTQKTSTQRSKLVVSRRSYLPGGWGCIIMFKPFSLLHESSCSCWLAERGSTSGLLVEMRRKGDEDEVIPPGTFRGRGPTAGMRVRKGRNQSRCTVRGISSIPTSNWSTWGVLPTHTPGADPWGLWDSWRGWPPFGRLRSNLGMWGHVRRPAYGMTVGLKVQTVAWAKLGESTSAGPGQRLFGWVFWKGDSP